jgi:hypothetical protein
VAVGEVAFGGWDLVDLCAIRRDRRMVDRNRYIPFLLAPRLAPPRFRTAHTRLVGTLGLLYTAIAQVAATAPASGEDACHPVVVDSSKHPSYLFLLRAMPCHELRLLHVVRDPRGVAHSWSKYVDRPESSQPMERLGTVAACARWTSHNLLFLLAARLRIPTTRLVYEQFTADPAILGDRLGTLLARPTGSSREDLVIDGGSVTLGVDHTVSGNPMRFSSGAVMIRSDDQWRTAMPIRARRTVGLLTSPLRQLLVR